MSSSEKGLERDVIFIMERRELLRQVLERCPATAARRGVVPDRQYRDDDLDHSRYCGELAEARHAAS